MNPGDILNSIELTDSEQLCNSDLSLTIGRERDIVQSPQTPEMVTLGQLRKVQNCSLDNFKTPNGDHENILCIKRIKFKALKKTITI